MSKIVASIKVGIEISSLSTISKALSESYGTNVKMRQSGELLEFFLDASEGSPERGTERTTKQMQKRNSNCSTNQPRGRALRILLVLGFLRCFWLSPPRSQSSALLLLYNGTPETSARLAAAGR